MATMSKVRLSAVADGLALKVGGTDTGTADVVHTAIAGTSDIDEIWLWASNTQAGAVKLTLEWGTDTAADGNIEVTIDGESGLTLIVPGLILQNEKTVEAFAGTTDVILIFGYVNRITA
tara:strand:- start:102 stop:458 length:357 start_codon:yes stop_codon:yes gene_type:complete